MLVTSLDYESVGQVGGVALTLAEQAGDICESRRAIKYI